MNYFIGNDRSKWYCDVPTSKAVLYKELYKNIDLKVYGIEKQIEYDWIVKVGGNPGNIRVEYKNVNGTRIDNQGNLVIETDFGELVHKKPVSYQKRLAHRVWRSAYNTGVGAGIRACPKERRDVNVTFKKIGENTYGFEVGEYDNSCELIIDPVVLAYSTYLGGGGIDSGMEIAVDSKGNSYVTGYTWSTDFPILNQYQTDQGDNDVFVTKIDTTQSGASSLIYSTYLCGGGFDFSTGIAADSNGIAYVTGDTFSTDFPTLNQYQTYQGNWDVFITKLINADTPTVITESVSYITANSSYNGGNITYDGGAAVTARGVCWSTSTNPTTADRHTTNGTGTGAFTSLITGLTPNTTYYVRAYATNAIGTAYGNQVKKNIFGLSLFRFLIF